MVQDFGKCTGQKSYSLNWQVKLCLLQLLGLYLCLFKLDFTKKRYFGPSLPIFRNLHLNINLLKKSEKCHISAKMPKMKEIRYSTFFNFKSWRKQSAFRFSAIWLRYGHFLIFSLRYLDLETRIWQYPS